MAFQAVHCRHKETGGIILKTVKLKSMRLENFKGKGTWNFQADFAKVTKISGRNRSGKSSVADGYFDCITGRLLDGSRPDSVRPHNESGEDVNRLPVIREAELEIDGKTTVISKKTEQKWRRPRGASEEVFDGNKTSFAIDGFESGNQKIFEAFIESIAPADTLLMCSNAQPFLALVRKSTSEARKLLEGLTGFSTEKFIAKNPKYAHIAEITKNHKIEDVLKQLRRDLNAQKKVAGEAKVKLDYERAREISVEGNIEIAELELLINGLKEQIAELDKQESVLDEVIKAYDEASSSVLELKFELSDLERKANEENEKKKRELDRKSVDFLNEIDDLERKIRKDKTYISSSSHNCETFKKQIEGYRQEWKRTNELEFDESSLSCPYCGQKLPIDKEAELREKFKKQKADDLERITINGNDLSRVVKSQEKERVECQKRIEEWEKQLAEVKEKLSANDKERANLPVSIDIFDTEEYKALQSQITEKEAALNAMNNHSEKRAEIKEERQQLLDEISEKKAVILKYQSDMEQKEKNVSTLEADLRNKNQNVADTEQKIDLLKDFSIEKNQQLAKEINPFFRHFQFEFLAFTQEQNPIETLRIVCNGTDYFSGLNLSDRILCEIDLVCGLQALNDLNLPVWADNCESIDELRLKEFIKDLQQQIVLLQRLDDEKLKVEILK